MSEKEKQYKPVPDVEALRYKGTPEKPDIKIFVSHRIDLDSKTIDNSLYIPVRCGAVYDERKNVTMLGDDTGDNISEKRMRYNELTVQYWAWKNVKADYYGLCHYRRYLSFSRNQHYLVNSFQLVEENTINEGTQKKYGLDMYSARMKIKLGDVDSFLPNLIDIRKIYNSQEFTHRDRYYQEIGKEFTDDCIKKLLNVIENLYPLYVKPCEEYFNQGKAYFCNCFLMRREVFNEYSEWLFNILFSLEKLIDFRKLSMKQSRILGFFSEDLFSIYFMNNTSHEPLNKCELQLIFFNETVAKPTLQPAFASNNVPIVLSCDDFYAPYMGVLIQSIIEKSHSNRNYDIIVLHTDIKKDNILLLKSLTEGRDNFSIRFTDISDDIGERNFSVWAHYKKYNVYRLVAPEVLSQYDKAIYFDSDIVVEKDVAELFDVDLGDNLIAAVPDIRANSWYNEENNIMHTYVKDTLKLPETHLYFNSGVLVYNLAKFRETYTSEYMLDYCAQRHWQYIDQDILNITCNGSTLFLPQKWNVLITADEFATEQKAPLSLYEDYCSAHNNPYVIHYAGNFMPCIVPTVDLRWAFWKYARNTPFYETFILRMIQKQTEFIQIPAQTSIPVPGRSGARIIADVLLPMGTRRREIVKALVPRGSLRWRMCKQIYYIFAPKYRPSKKQ